ncbi:MAG: lactonase family protein, partial [Candidatus Binatus sp.]
MGIEQRIGLSLFRRTALRNVVRLIPAIVIVATMLNTFSCGSSGLLQPANSGSPTSTATAGTGALAFVTNFNDGKVSSFTRNTKTGVLKHTGQVTAGKKSGPRGVIATPNGNFLYVANINDDNIYEFSIDQNNGTLTALTPAFVSNGNASGPDELAINPDGTLLWVTDAHDGTVTSYAIDVATGQLTKNSSIGGFNTPFGITLHPRLAVLYVSDTATGLIWPMTYDTTTGALSKNFVPAHSSDAHADTPAAIAIDAAGAALFIA